ncbi:transglycosylase SLT domain-containing protein [Pseudoalteromonas rhizosphaerae]|uniref:transglycosylase SLT domain-containing protein n=1 Tax=Pseudoalteromonas rhizosphaerae TaxID=2518973 RepID=UPI001C555A47|nr:transglycosylase SLT domain-containing protein [Pseudoalteromonas rhizosphaerae]
MLKIIGRYLFCMACSLLVLPCYSASLSLSCKYDGDIISAVKRFSPGRDPDLLKAQLWQESRFKTDAVSPVGASGIAQFMPATWQEQTGKLGLAGSPFDAELSILVAARYMQQQFMFWSSPRPEYDRENLALCNYNAGAGNCVKAQKLSGGEVLYPHIIQYLPQVTGHHSRETIEYVQHIRRYQLQIKARLPCY